MTIRINRAAVPGYPIVTRRALRAGGVDRNAIARRIADGRLVTVLPDTYLIGVTPHLAPPNLIARAAVESIAPPAQLIGTTALDRLELWNRHDGVLHIGSHGWRPSNTTPPVVYHRMRKLAEPVDIDCVPVQPALAAAVTAAQSLTPHQLAYVLDQLRYRERLTLGELSSCLVLVPGQRGAATVRAAMQLLDEGCIGTKNRSEDHLLPHLVRELGMPLVNVRDSTILPGFEPDFCYPDRRLVIEIDGDQHTNDRHARAQDAERDRLLTAAGWRVERIAWRRVWNDLPGVLERARTAHVECAYLRLMLASRDQSVHR